MTSRFVVLIPVVIPERVRYRFLHNQIDVVLSAALRTRPDVVVARVQLPLQVLANEPSVADHLSTGAGTTEGANDPEG